MASGPLDGLRVLDLTRLLPGFGTAVLADLGADVVKVEQPGLGDYMRWDEPRIGAESAKSWVTDRNKRSIALDLKDPRAVEALTRLAATADALVESFRPGVVDRLGIGYEALRAVNPRLVYVSLSGYGQDGPLAATPGHDINFLGRAGLLSITGTSTRPVLPGVQIADIGGGALLALVGMLAAILQARESGVGDHVDVSMTDGAFAWLSIHLGDYLASGDVPGRERMLLNGHVPCYNVYACADGRYLTVGALEQRFWHALCEGVDRRDLEGTQHDPSAVPTWRELFAARDRDDWLARLPAAACVGPVNDLAEAVADRQLVARQMVVELDHATAGRFRQLGLPIKLRRRPGSVRSPAPALGQTTRELLAEVGYDEAAIGDLLADGVAAEPPAGRPER